MWPTQSEAVTAPERCEAHCVQSEAVTAPERCEAHCAQRTLCKPRDVRSSGVEDHIFSSAGQYML